MNQTVLSRPDEADKYLVYAKLDNAKILHQLVKAVNFKDVNNFRHLFFFLNLNAFLIESMLSFVPLRMDSK